MKAWIVWHRNALRPMVFLTKGKLNCYLATIPKPIILLVEMV